MVCQSLSFAAHFKYQNALAAARPTPPIRLEVTSMTVEFHPRTHASICNWYVPDVPNKRVSLRGDCPMLPSTSPLFVVRTTTTMTNAAVVRWVSAEKQDRNLCMPSFSTGLLPSVVRAKSWMTIPAYYDTAMQCRHGPQGVVQYTLASQSRRRAIATCEAQTRFNKIAPSACACFSSERCETPAFANKIQKVSASHLSCSLSALHVE